MRRARIKVAADEGEAVYHLISRTVNGERVIGPAGKELLRRQIWQVADFAGLEVITYAILSNHFHILVRVPQKAAVTDEELLRRYSVLYPRPTRYQTARLDVVRSQMASNGPEAVAWRKRQLALMYDVSQYMKLVKERFSIWHNKTRRRFGPVWSDRFKSVLVEPTGHVIQTIAAYIDLNCVRAGLVRDPKDYRFCGYAEAVSGGPAARAGIRIALGGAHWDETHAMYRQLLFLKGGEVRTGRAEIALEDVQKVIRDGGRLPIAEVLRCRVRYFSMGAVLGSRVFVETQIAAYQHRCRHGVRMGAHPLPPVAEWGELAGLRRLPDELIG